MRLQQIASAAVSPFAHLIGLTPKAKPAKAEGDEKEDKDKDDKGAKKADDKTPPENDKERGSKAETEKDDEGVESEEDKDKAASTSAEAEDDEDEDKDEDKDDKKKKEDAKAEKAERAELNGEGEKPEARDRERARCRSIFSSKAAANRPHVAASLAFDTLMTAGEAINVMKGMGPVEPPKAGKPSLDSRMAATATPNPGDASGLKENQTGDNKMTAAKIIAAGDKARGIVPKAK